jgi:hypothetical protein
MNKPDEQNPQQRLTSFDLEAIRMIVRYELHRILHKFLTEQLAHRLEDDPK